VSLRRKLDSKSDLMNGVLETVTQPLSHLIAVVLRHDPQVAAAGVTQVVIELDRQNKTAQVGAQFFRRRGDASQRGKKVVSRFL